MGYEFLNIFFFVFHTILMLFNCFGWAWKKTRRWNLFTLLLTAASWFIVGIWYGWGYCFLTDWQWTVKEKLGETNLPSSFIKYFADKLTGSDINPSLINTTTLVCFIAAVGLTIYVNLFKTRIK